MPEEAEDRAGRDLEVEVADRPVLAEALAEALGHDARAPFRQRGECFRVVYHCFVHRTKDHTRTMYEVKARCAGPMGRMRSGDV